MAVRLGIIGTSWWVDSMYLPALTTLDEADIVALAGRRIEGAEERARQWSIPAAYDDWRAMLSQEQLDGVIVAASNPVHYPATKEALVAGLHVLCEKPVAATYPEAAELATLARERSAITMVPFTYAFMPGFRWMEHLISDGYVGDIHHIGLRYHAGYALADQYDWKLDARRNPTGALGDIGSHFLYLAERLAGSVRAVTAQLDVVGRHVERDDRGEAYPLAPDSAIVVLGFDSGAHGVLHSSSVAYEGTSMNQRHTIDVHGSAGKLRYEVDWDEMQIVRGTRIGQGPDRQLPIPDEIWGDLRRDTVHNTYRDVFRTTDAMARGWVKAIERGEAVQPDLAAGAEVQLLLDASLQSSEEGRRIDVSEARG